MRASKDGKEGVSTGLMGLLAKTTTHYIRCVKPNDSMAAFGCSSNVPGFDILRIITSSAVLLCDGDPKKGQVCFQVKNALEILEIYALRAKLHRQVYQHHIANVTEAMITDVFLAADKHFRVKGGPGSAAGGVPLSEAAHDTDAFVRLNDSILDALDMSTEEGLGEAHALLARLKRRDFYRQVGSQVNIETLPMCANPHCRKGTPIDARYCLQCGETTSTLFGRRERERERESVGWSRANTRMCK